MVYVLLADGFEEVEAVTVIDILRRGGVETVTAGISGAAVTGTHGIPVCADLDLRDGVQDDPEMVVLPGGQPGTDNLRSDARVNELIDRTLACGGTVGAICAAPMVPGGRGLLEGRRAVCYPGCEGALIGADISDAAVVHDGPFVTSKGPGTAAEFGLYLLGLLKGGEVSDSVRADMLL